MSDLSFIFYSLRSRLLNSTLSVFLTAFGVSLALLLTQFGNHIQNRLIKDGKNIDIVVGSKGSPLQLILSTVYHVDNPPGNIALSDAEILMKNPLVKSSIPIALGDNWKGYRIVGTTYEYLDHYNAFVEKGRLWKKDFEIVVGSAINLDINSEISGAHGLLEGGNVHHDEKYKVVGIMNQTGTVLDRLILTSLGSVLKIHEFDDHNEKKKDLKNNHVHPEEKKNDHHTHSAEEEHQHDHHDKQSEDDDHGHNNISTYQEKEYNTKEITALIIKTSSPIANINLPRQINKETSMLAANPAVEITRLTTMLGLGSRTFAILSIILIAIASLSIFSGLAANLENRLGDLAILRALGYSKKRIFKIICFEGMILTVLGIFFGILIGMIVFNFFIQAINSLNISQASFRLIPSFFLIITCVFFAGFFAAILPAYRASKISVANQLSKNI